MSGGKCSSVFQSVRFGAALSSLLFFLLSLFSLARARFSFIKKSFQPESSPTPLSPSLLLLPLGLDHELVGHQRDDRRRRGDLKGGQGVLPSPDAVRGHRERSHPRREKIVAREALDSRCVFRGGGGVGGWGGVSEGAGEGREREKGRQGGGGGREKKSRRAFLSEEKEEEEEKRWRYALPRFWPLRVSFFDSDPSRAVFPVSPRPRPWLGRAEADPEKKEREANASSEPLKTFFLDSQLIDARLRFSKMLPLSARGRLHLSLLRSLPAAK